MSVFVVVALALAVTAVGMVVVAGFQVRAALHGLRTAVGDTTEMLRPLATELSEEMAVAGRELEAVTTRQKEGGRRSRARVH